jgi:SAM-dependent methyltransferase
MPLANDPDLDWERFGQADPYFAVLSDERFHRERMTDADRAAFFDSGREHVARVLDIVRERLDPAFAPARALDFGCGVGRLLLPLAERCAEVTGVDVSAAMLAEARRNCEAAGLANVRLVPSDDGLSRVEGRFDFVHSYIVLQHVPVRRGERLVALLAERLAPGGVGMFHVTYTQPMPPLGRALYWARTRVPGAHGLLNLALGRARRTPLMQVNAYSVTRLLELLRARGCAEAHVRFSDHAGSRGVLLFCRKAAVAGF